MTDITTPDTVLTNIRNIPFTVDKGIAYRAAIGVIVLATDETIEHEWRVILRPAGVAYFESRIPNSTSITPETLKAMEARITAQTDVILPGVPLDVVAYGCTSASVVIGEENVFAKIHAARPDVACTTPITAAMAAFNAFGAKRIGILTPYRDDVNAIFRDYLTARGFEIPVFGSFNEEDDRVVARIDADSIRNGIAQVTEAADVDAVFISCTSMRLAEAIVDIEEAVGKPVTSSNHAMAWHCLRLGGVDDKMPEFGRLFAL